MKCPSCGRANPSDRVECEACAALLVDVFDGDQDSKTDPIQIIGTAGVAAEASSTAELLRAARELTPPEASNKFRHLPTDVLYTGDLPRLYKFSNRYQILEKLGEGGMGRVYKALDQELDKPVALKTIRAEKGHGPEILSRFKQELLLARKITHKNVIRIYDLGESDGMKYFTMELVEGKSLRDLLREKKRLSATEALGFMKQMLHGLDEAHRQGVVHRDLKPQNIMVDEQGVLKIMDFGIARTADSATMTGSGEMMGTPDYISPEQVKGERADAQSDIFSCGVILYELLTGEAPFKGDTPLAKIVARIQVTPTPPRSLNPEIPAYLERIVVKCMEADCDLRYKSAEEVLQDIEREQVDSSFALRARKALARHRGWVAAAAVACAIGSWSWLERSSETGRNPPTSPAQVAVTSLAVLPFHNTADVQDLGWMENGIPEMLITDISQSQALRPVMAGQINRILEDLGKQGQSRFDEETIKVVSEMANAAYALHGGFVSSDKRLRVNLTLRETSTGLGTPILVDGELEDVFSLVDAITDRVTSELAPDAKDNDRPITEVSTSNLGAFRAYHQGLSELRDGSNQLAIPLFEEATMLDPGFAMARARLAEAHWNLGNLEEASAAIASASELAKLEPLPAVERYQIHAIEARIQEDDETAVQSYREILKLYPTDTDARLSLATALENLGNVEESLGEYEAILKTAPDSGAALLGLGRSLVITGRSKDAVPKLQEALDANFFSGDPEALGMIHSILGVAYRDQGQLRQAIDEFATSLEYRKQAGDARGQAATLTNMGNALRGLGEWDSANTVLEEALQIAREQNNTSMESFALLDLGSLRADTGDLEGALDYFRASFEIEWERQDHTELPIRMNSIADVYRRMGRFGDATVYLEQAKTHLERSADQFAKAENLSILGRVDRDQGRYEDASAALLSSTAIFQQIDQPHDVAAVQSILAVMYADQGRYAEALATLEQSLQTMEGRGLPLRAALVRFQLAHVLATIGETALARQHAEQAAVQDIVDTQSVASLVLGQLALASGRYDDALERFDASRMVAVKSRDPVAELEARLAAGQAHWMRGALASARTSLEETKSSANRARLRVIEAKAYAELARTCLALRDFEHARDHARAALRLAALFDGAPVQRTAQLVLVEVAEHEGRDEDAASIRAEVSALTEWIEQNVPERYRESFSANLLEKTGV